MEILSEQFGFCGKVKCYASSAALQSEVVQSRQGHPTLLLEFARKGGSGYAWGEKVSFQLTDRDLPLWAAVVLGKSNETKMSFHGTENDKAVEVKKNPRSKGLLVVNTSPKGAIAVPVSPEDQFWLATQCLRVFKARAPDVEGLAVIHLLGSLVA